jgi:hypothetical protein
MEWVGREMDAESAKSGDPAVVLFFEVGMAEGVKGARLRHAVLLDVFRDQMNLLHLSDGTGQAELKFTTDQPARNFSASK